MAHTRPRADSRTTTLSDLAGARIGFASSDSPQATILPIYFMREEGFDPERDAHAQRLEIDLGKHGDTGGTELEQLRRLVRGEIDAVLSDATCAGAIETDAVDGVAVRRVWTSPPYHHCNFTTLPDHNEDATQGFCDGLLLMRPDDPAVAAAMREEWVTRWVEGDETGYAALLRCAVRTTSIARGTFAILAGCFPATQTVGRALGR